MIKSFISLVLITLLFLSSIGLTIHRVKDPAFLNEQVRSANLYGRLTESLPKLLDDKMFEESGFAKEDLVDVISNAIDSQMFYGFVEQATRAFLPWLTSEKASLDFQYDLGPVKSSVRDKAIDRMLSRYNQLPICNADQVKGWSTESGLPPCQLPSSNVRSSDITRLFGEQIDKTLEGVPSHLIASETPKLQEARARVTSSLRVIQAIWLITGVVFLLFLGVLRRYAFLSLAFVFLLTGLIEAVFGLIAWDWVGKLVIDSMPNNANGVLPVAIELVTTALDVLKRALSAFSVALIVIGAAFLISWIVWRPKSKHSTVST